VVNEFMKSYGTSAGIRANLTKGGFSMHTVPDETEAVRGSGFIAESGFEDQHSHTRWESSCENVA
jgi:hypothetical protein